MKKNNPGCNCCKAKDCSLQVCFCDYSFGVPSYPHSETTDVLNCPGVDCAGDLTAQIDWTYDAQAGEITITLELLCDGQSLGTDVATVANDTGGLICDDERFDVIFTISPYTLSMKLQRVGFESRDCGFCVSWQTIVRDFPEVQICAEWIYQNVDEAAGGYVSRNFTFGSAPYNPVTERYEGTIFDATGTRSHDFRLQQKADPLFDDQWDVYWNDVQNPGPFGNEYTCCDSAGAGDWPLEAFQQPEHQYSTDGIVRSRVGFCGQECGASRLFKIELTIDGFVIPVAYYYVPNSQFDEGNIIWFFEQDDNVPLLVPSLPLTDIEHDLNNETRVENYNFQLTYNQASGNHNLLFDFNHEFRGFDPGGHIHFFGARHEIVDAVDFCRNEIYQTQFLANQETQAGVPGNVDFITTVPMLVNVKVTRVHFIPPP